MRKWIAFFALFLMTLVLFFSGYLYCKRAEFAALFLSRSLSVPVKMKELNFSQHGVVVKGLRINNPPGCSDKPLLVADRIDIKLDWGNLLKSVTGISSENIYVDQIKVSDPEIRLEILSLLADDTNFKRLLGASPSSKEKESRKFEIGRCTLLKTKISISHPLLGTSIRPTTIAKIEVKHIGSNNPQGLREASFIILSHVSEAILKEVDLKNLQKNLFDKAAEKGLQMNELLNELLPKK